MFKKLFKKGDKKEGRDSVAAAAPVEAAAADAGGGDMSLGEGSKVGIDDFDLMKVLGKGSFGKVMMVRKKDDGNIYAMKTLRKEALIKRNQLLHTQTERSIVQHINHPFLTTLAYAFQTVDKL
jgi:serine/threonine protein kinase